MKRLNFGCGGKARKGYVNLDIVKMPGVDVVHDLEKIPYPFKKNTFDEVLINHVIEHMSDIKRTMEELHRICKPKARIFITGPYFANRGAYKDPTHKSFLTWDTFNYFSPDFKFSYYTKAKFKVIRKKLRFTKIWLPIDPLINLFPVIYERFFCWILPAAEIKYELEVIK